MAQSEMNQIQIDDMSSLVNDPQNKKMYRAVNKNRVSNTNKTQTIGMMQLPDNSIKTNTKLMMQAVAYFCIHDVVREVYKAGEKTYSDTVIVNCENMYSERFTIKIDYARFSKKLIKSAFEEQARHAVFSADIKETLMNHLLFNYIRSTLKEQIVEIPEKAGFYSNNSGYQYISHTDGTYETETVRQAKYMDYPTDSIDYQVLKSRLENDSLLMVLTVLDIASFMYTILRDNGHDFRKIIAVTGCDTREKLSMFRDFFNVFDRDDDDTLSLNLKLNELRNILFSRKDETVIFEDDASTKNRLAENIRFLYDSCVKRRKFDNEIAECNCMILCSQAQTMAVLEEYADSILWIDVSEMRFYSDMIALKQRIRNTIIRLAKSDKALSMLFDVSEYHAQFEDDVLLKSLHTIEIICDKVLKIGLDIGMYSEKYVLDISNYLEQSRHFFDAEYIIKQFKNVISNAIIHGEIAFMSSGENTPIVYVKDDLMLFSVNDFADLERKIPFGLIDRTPKTNGIRFRSVLREKGYLVTNNGDKLLYKSSVSENSADRMNFIALKKSLLTENAQRLVPVVKKKGISTAGYQPPDNTDGKERIFLGMTMDTQQPVYWSIGNIRLANQHMYIQADSGSGKTTLLFLLAQRLYRAGKKVVIFDFAEKTSYSVPDIETMDKNFTEITGFSVFEKGFSIDELVYRWYSNLDISEMFRNEKIYIIHCVPTYAVLILQNIFKWLNIHNSTHEHDTYAILDEINSLNFEKRFSEENKQSIADVLFRQGRSIGLHLISATQFLAKDGSREKELLLNQSATKIALHLSRASSTGVAKTIDNKRYEYYKDVLDKMTKGQGIVYSGVELADGSITNSMPLQISISPMKP